MQVDEPDGSIASKNNPILSPWLTTWCAKVIIRKDRPFFNPSRGRSDRHGGGRETFNHRR